MFQIVWEFRVAPEHQPEFEKTYAPQGAWATLFAQSSEFRGTQLLRDPAVPGRYLTIDSWQSAAAFDQFKEQNVAAYKQLDQRCEPLTAYELKLGAFEIL
jgi:heme-degrading monooxygenase HmoA